MLPIPSGCIPGRGILWDFPTASHQPKKPQIPRNKNPVILPAQVFCFAPAKFQTAPNSQEYESFLPAQRQVWSCKIVKIPKIPRDMNPGILLAQLHCFPPAKSQILPNSQKQESQHSFCWFATAKSQKKANSHQNLSSPAFPAVPSFGLAGNRSDGIIPHWNQQKFPQNSSSPCSSFSLHSQELPTPSTSRWHRWVQLFPPSQKTRELHNHTELFFQPL